MPCRRLRGHTQPCGSKGKICGFGVIHGISETMELFSPDARMPPLRCHHGRRGLLEATVWLLPAGQHWECAEVCAPHHGLWGREGLAAHDRVVPVRHPRIDRGVVGGRLHLKILFHCRRINTRVLQPARE